MSNDVDITVSESVKKGSVLLYKSNLGGEENYYGKYERKLINSKTLYARIQKKNAGTSLHEVQKIVGMLKEAIIEAVEAGESINLMDLMTLYISVEGKIEKSSINKGSTPTLSVKITPKAILKKAAKNIKIKAVNYADTDIAVEKITDRFTMECDGTVTQCAEVQLEGRRLKIKGENAGIWLCPVTGTDGKIDGDETKWIKCPRITNNTAKCLTFYVPFTAVAGCRYRILIKTFWMNGEGELKTPKTILTNSVTVKAMEL